ncbi:MAG: hypothetical protein VB130_16015, partial [Clostridium sp.]|nr:hypothetical protein [Clostridium sp.]
CGELLSHNMFIYSINNPVNMSDPSGFRPLFTANEETNEMREASFAAMRSAAKQSGGTIKTNNVVQAKLGNKGAPNSKDKLYNKDGSVKQERVYGPDEKPLLDTDWNHGGVGHVFPHTHEWKDGERQDGVPFHGAPPPPRSVSNTQISRWATAGITLYWVVSEGSRIVFPPRNLVPIP